MEFSAEQVNKFNSHSSFDVQEDLTSSHHSLGRMERELWAAEDKNGSRKRVANPWQVNNYESAKTNWFLGGGALWLGKVRSIVLVYRQSGASMPY